MSKPTGAVGYTDCLEDTGYTGYKEYQARQARYGKQSRQGNDCLMVTAEQNVLSILKYPAKVKYF